MDHKYLNKDLQELEWKSQMRLLMFYVKMVYLTVPITVLLVTKIVTEYKNLFSFWEILRHVLFSIKQFLYRHYSEFEILRFLHHLCSTLSCGDRDVTSLPSLSPGRGCQGGHRPWQVSQHLKEPGLPEPTWKGDPTPAVSALQINPDPKEPFLSFPSRAPNTSLLEEKLSLPSVLIFYTRALITFNQKKRTQSKLKNCCYFPWISFYQLSTINANKKCNRGT